MSNYGRDRDLGRINRRPYRSAGLDRQQRLSITLAVGAILLLLVGGSIGFGIGRATAPEPVPQEDAKLAIVATQTPLPSGVVEEVATDTMAADAAADEQVQDAAVDEEPPPRPKQKSPSDYAVLKTSRVDLRWSKVADDSDKPVTYSFEIQDRLSDGTWGHTQVISGLKTTSYSARVLYVTRRWRVWAVDEADNASKKTGWWHYKHKAKPAPKPQPSDETT